MNLGRWLGLGRRPTGAAPERVTAGPHFAPLFPDPEAAAIGSVFALHRIRASSGDPVSAEISTGRVVNRPPRSAEPLQPLVLVRARRNPALGFLVAPADPDLAIKMEADALRASILPYLVERGADPGKVRLRHPVTRGYVCALPFTGTQAADLVCNRTEAGAWEHFSVDEVEPDPADHGLARLLERIAAPFATMFDAGAMLAWLAGDGTGGATGRIGSALLRLLPPEEMSLVARAMLGEAGAPAFLARCLDDDARGLLADLRRWNTERDAIATMAIDDRLDGLGNGARGEENGSADRLAASLARLHVSPRRELCVVATARNEGIYLLEWIAHHRAVGADHVFLYSNDNNDGSDALLQALAASGTITWIDNRFAPRVDGQVKAYGHALSVLPQTLDFRWTLIVDLDEFLILNRARYANLPELLDLREREGATAVAFSWALFTPGGAQHWDQRPLIERFTFQEPGGNSHVKTAFRTNRYRTSYPHDPIPVPGLPTEFRAASGRLHQWPGKPTPPSEGEPDYDHAWIAHYHCKSVDEFLWKTARNRGGFELQPGLSFKPEALPALFRWFDPALSTENRSALPMLPPLQAELDRLRSLPGVAAAEEAVRTSFRSSVAALRRAAREAVERGALPQAIGEGARRVFLTDAAPRV